jgi:hypothetical protein
MKNFIKFFGITAIALVIGLFTISCDTEPPEDDSPSPKTTPSAGPGVPTNVKITVNKRTMIVTWDEVANATGYEIITYSEGCGSGRRIINTKDRTAYSFDMTATNPTVGTTNVITAASTNATSGTPQSNGAVIILAKNAILITLMPATSGDDMANTPMATSIRARVKSLESLDDAEDSEYSNIVTLDKTNFIKPALGTPVNGVPTSLTINIVKRSMLVTWDEVTAATGYEITTYSEGCGSGRRQINTEAKTAYSFDGTNLGTTNVLNNANATTGLQNNGSVIILAKNAILITLMPNTNGNQDIPMATSVTAKVKSIKSVSGADSAYSSVISKTIAGGMGGM